MHRHTRQAPQQPVFRLDDKANVIPVATGKPGGELMTAEQAAEITGEPVDELLGHWYRMFRDNGQTRHDTGFRFNVGPDAYRLIFVRDLADEDGTPLMGRCDADNLRIYLDAEHRGRNLEQTLIHELSHAWDFAVGAPRDAEALADRTATIMRSLQKDLQDQGGIVALHKERRRFAMTMATVRAETGDDLYVVASELDPVDVSGEARAGRAACAKCGQVFADGAVVNDPHRYDREAKWTTVRRTLHCPGCNHLQSWDEGTWLGLPNGQVVRGPFFRTGVEVVQFLVDHPQTAGVMVG